jgi:WD40 repeat protein
MTDAALITDLPPEVLSAVLGKLPLPALLSASATCTQMQHAMRAHAPQIFSQFLRHPRISPYACQADLASLPTDGLRSFREAARLRLRWRLQPDRRNSAFRKACGLPMIIAFDAFVRSITVDYERQCIAVGTSQGFVTVVSIRNSFRRRYADAEPTLDLPPVECPSRGMRGAPHEAQVIALAMDGRSGLVVSGDGAPPWRPDLDCPSPTLKVWALDRAHVAEDREPAADGEVTGHLVHTLHGHRDSILTVHILGHSDPFRASGNGAAAGLHATSLSKDGVVFVWRLSDGQRVAEASLQ